MKDLEAQHPEKEPPLLKIENLWLVYPPPNQVEALRGIDLTIRRGEFVAFIGQNGSGKSTLTKCISGFLRPTKGCVYVNGKDNTKIRTSKLAQVIGYVFQNPDHQLFKENIFSELAFGLKNIGKSKDFIEKKVEQVLKRMHLWEARDAHPFQLGKGERERVAIAAILAMEPEVLIVDEPTTGQDRREARTIMKLMAELNKEGVTVIFITHAMHLVAEYAKRVVALYKGQILIDGDVREVFSQPSLLAKTYIQPPQITRFGINLEISPLPLGVNEAIKMLLGEIQGGR
ncbi:MAG: energy-coupling factor ABC transporter ATP-binding protein [Candidatus Heimdallarchaeota archaeon]